MLFGEYLVLKNILSEEQLVEALIHQQEKSPSLLRILLEDLKIPAKKINLLVRYQINETITLSEAQKKYKILSEIEFSNALAILAQKRKALGEIIVEKNFASIQVIQDNFLNFLKEVPISPAQEINNKVNEEVVETSNQEEVEVDEAALESLRELVNSGLANADILEGLNVKSKTEEVKIEPKVESDTQKNQINGTEGLDEEFVSNFLDAISTKNIDVIKQNIHNAAESLQTKKYDQLSLELENLFRGIHRFKGAAKLARAKICETVLNRIEAKFKSIAPELKQGNLESFNKFSDYFDQGVGILEDLRRVIEKNQSEAPFLDNTLYREGYNYWLKTN